LCSHIGDLIPGVDTVTTPLASPAPGPTHELDELDGRILTIFTTEPRIGVLECSRRLGVARGTVQARLDRLVRDGVIRGWGPQVDTAAMGYSVTAFATLEIRQSSSHRPGHDAVATHLASIPEVLEVHTITGSGDMFARIVARSNSDLQRVIDRIVDSDSIVRTSTVIALATQIPFRVQPLLQLAGGDVPPPGPARPARTRAKSA
jgi:DNA-binding Lrp family transcriptional regulator